MFRFSAVTLFFLSAAFLVSGCTGLKQNQTQTQQQIYQDQKIMMTDSLTAIGENDYPAFSDDIRFSKIKDAAEKTLEYLYKVPSSKTFRYGADSYTAVHMRKSVKKFMDFVSMKPSPSRLNNFIKDNYTVYKASGSPENGKMMFTGYYEPFLKGSLKKTSRYRYPVYATPNDLPGKSGTCKSGAPVKAYHDRYEIEEMGALEGKADVLAWVDDRIDLFFLQIQGSGVIHLESGGSIKVHYSGSNQHPYTSIGKYFISKGIFTKEDISMQKMREWLLDHPDKISEILCMNKSYVFFEEEPDGPIGCLNVKITEGRSIALDRKVYPDAGIAFVSTEKPVTDSPGKVKKWVPFSRFVFNQDTGGAIKGPGRADFFWGSGEYAKTAAGHMKQDGELYFLVLKQ